MSLLPGLVLAVAACAGVPPERAAWLELRTENFDVVCGLPVALCRELAADAERFRSAVAQLSGRPIPPAATRTRILAFDGRGFRRPFLVDGERGYFLPDPGGPLLVLRAGRGWRGDAGAALQHDFAHQLLRSQGELRPLWVEEGLAQVASRVELLDDRTVLGADHPRHRSALRGRAARSLRDTREAVDLSTWSEPARRRFEAESWGIVHHLLFGQRQPAEPSAARPPDALERPLPDDRTLAAAVNELARDDEIATAHLSTDAPASAIPVARPMARTTGLTRMGQLAVALERPELARRYLEYVLVLEPANAAAHAGLAVAAGMQKDWSLAEEYSERALVLAPDDADALLAAARVGLARAAGPGAPGSGAGLDQAVAWLRRCVEVGPERAECQARLAAALLVSGGDLDAALLHAERAASLLPGSLENRLLVAEVLARQGQIDRARALAIEVASRSHRPASVRAAQALLGDLAPARQAGP